MIKHVILCNFKCKFIVATQTKIILFVNNIYIYIYIYIYVFTPGPIVSYKSARKISSYIARAKRYPLERKVSSEKCGKSRCEVCLNIQETGTFTKTTTGETFKINHKLNCDDNCLIYFLTCKYCGKQYVGGNH